jgi:hypothetical protein
VVAVLSVLYPLSFWGAVGIGSALGLVAGPFLALRAGAPLKEKPGWRHLRWPLIAFVGLAFQATVVGAVWEFGDRSVEDFLFTAEHAAYVILDGSDFEKAADKRFNAAPVDPSATADAGPTPDGEDGGPASALLADGGSTLPQVGDGGLALPSDAADAGSETPDEGGPTKPKKPLRKRAKVNKLPRALPSSAVYINYTGYGQFELDLDRQAFEVAQKQMRAAGDNRTLYVDKGKSVLTLKWSLNKIWTVEYQPLARASAKKKKAASRALHQYLLKAFGEPDDERMIPSGTRLRWESGENTVVLYLPTPQRGKPDGITSDAPWVIMTNNYAIHRKTRKKGF